MSTPIAVHSLAELDAAVAAARQEGAIDEATALGAKREVAQAESERNALRQRVEAKRASGQPLDAAETIFAATGEVAKWGGDPYLMSTVVRAMPVAFTGAFYIAEPAWRSGRYAYLAQIFSREGYALVATGQLALPNRHNVAEPWVRVELRNVRATAAPLDLPGGATWVWPEAQARRSRLLRYGAALLLVPLVLWFVFRR